MIAAADVPNLRGPLGVKVMQHGKHYFTDKTPFTTLEQIDAARKAVVRDRQTLFVYYGERLASESGMYAGELVKQGAIGRVIQLVGLGPHRLNAPARPDWFFKKEQYGGIIIDLACHQLEQFLYYPAIPTVPSRRLRSATTAILSSRNWKISAPATSSAKTAPQCSAG